MAISIEIEGLDRLIHQLSPELIAKPLRHFFERAAITVQSRAREKAPVDTGRLRSSITYELDKRPVTLWAKVGTNLAYAPYMEYGTGLFAEGPGARGGRHFPPSGALDVWASRHGFSSGGQVAQIVGRRGGLKPRRYLRNAIKESVADIQSLLARLQREIRENWEKR